VSARGEVDGRLLETVAASAISDASGRARLEARVAGTLAAPKIQARVDLGNLKFRLRDLGREVAVEGGTIEASKHRDSSCATSARGSTARVCSPSAPRPAPRAASPSSA
jgi:autotransporter translocation and assembly factor TamB